MRRHNANQNTVSVFIFFSKSEAPHNLLVNKSLITGTLVTKATLKLFNPFTNKSIKDLFSQRETKEV
ncbi:hypothetical protein HHL01_03615 [Pseudoalteromonas arctica]|uniref:Uncharacterized protein n=1 Tax=Pseudoalteromonas arctica TaxID=394751 RepID=A0A7X9U442_9GAMM|nr:hypothetical protein [Pseudoalteromonas arctica]NMF47276.1 hypothetical protein [Pseudoalteromonas arctica]